MSGTLDVELTGEERESVACWSERRVQKRFVGGEDKSMGGPTDDVTKGHCDG